MVLKSKPCVWYIKYICNPFVGIIIMSILRRYSNIDMASNHLHSFIFKSWFSKLIRIV